MPTRKRITSKDENFITFSISIVFVIRSIDVPRKAKVSLKLQNNKVPNIDTEKIAMDTA